MKKYSSDYYSRLCSKKTLVIVSLFAFVVAFACESALYIPTSNQETNATDLANLQAGRKLYIQKCGSCHTLYLPEKYTNQEWHHWVNKMTPIAKVDTFEKEQILNYLNKGR